MAEEHNIPKVYDPASVEKKWYKYCARLRKLAYLFTIFFLYPFCSC